MFDVVLFKEERLSYTLRDLQLNVEISQFVGHFYIARSSSGKY